MFWLCKEYKFWKSVQHRTMINTILCNIFKLAKMIDLKLNVPVTKIKKK